MEVELEDTKILWPGGVLYGGGETYENGEFCIHYKFSVALWKLFTDTCSNCGP